MVTLTEAKRMVSRWGNGTFDSRKQNIRHHAEKRGNGDMWRYLRKAYGFNKKGAAVKLLPDSRVHIERKSGEFIIEYNGYVSPTAKIGPASLRDRANYLPAEAQTLRRCIAELYRESILLYRKAYGEYRRKNSRIQQDKNQNIWDLVGLYPDDICGYAQRAELRVPVRYPVDAAVRLKRAALFELPGVLDWLLTDGREMPKVRQYLEAVDYLRLLTLDYIQRYDEYTMDLKSF